MVAKCTEKGKVLYIPLESGWRPPHQNSNPSMRDCFSKLFQQILPKESSKIKKTVELGKLSQQGHNVICVAQREKRGKI